MALITISGYPCSGKSRRAETIKASLEERLKDPSYGGLALQVVCISDDTLGLDRSAYDGVTLFAHFPHPPRSLFLSIGAHLLRVAGSSLTLICGGVCRQPFGETSAWCSLHGDAETNGSQYAVDCGWDELYQGVQVSDVLCGEGVQAEGLHCASLPHLFFFLFLGFLLRAAGCVS